MNSPLLDHPALESQVTLGWNAMPAFGTQPVIQNGAAESVIALMHSLLTPPRKQPHSSFWSQLSHGLHCPSALAEPACC